MAGRRLGRRVGGLSMALVAVWSAALSGVAGAAQTTRTAGNANFVGVWGSEADGGWVVTSQSPSGACVGTSDFPGYGFIDCQVSGDSYSFTVTDGSYESFNTGTIDGNVANGSFTDTNGTTESYSVPREGGGAASATEVLCGQQISGNASGGQAFSCTAIVADASGSATPSTPTGTVDFALEPGAPGGLGSTACTLQASGYGPTAFCSVPYDAPGGSVPTGDQPQLVATYEGDQNFSSSTGSPTDQIASADLGALASVVTQDANDCAAQLAAAPATASGDVLMAPLVNAPAVQFQPTDGALGTAAKTCMLVPRGIGYVVGGASYGAGATMQAVSQPVGTAAVVGGTAAIVGSPLAGPAAPAVVTGGMVSLVAGGFVYYVGNPIGQGLSSLGSTILSDPPDVRYRQIAPPRRVAPIVVPRGAPSVYRDLVALATAKETVLADAGAMETAINRAGGASRAHARLWVGRQTRTALADGRLEVAALRTLKASEATFARAYAGSARHAAPLSARLLARARTAARRPLHLPAYALELLSAFGITAGSLRSMVSHATVGSRPAATVAPVPFFDATATFTQAAVIGYGKVPEIGARARMR